MPVMKNEFDIYKTSRSRHGSECSNSSACRSRKVSECRSECPSLSTSPGTADYVSSPAHRPQINRTNSRPFSRTSSRTSQSSLTSPTKTNTGCSPPKPTSGSQGSLNKFHIRLVDKLRKSLRKGRSEDRSWGAQDLMTTITANTNSTATHQLSFSTNTGSSTPLDDGGLGYSDSVLHITSSKPPLPRGTTHRSRSRSIETATYQLSRQEGRLWSRKSSHEGVGESYSRPR